MTATQLQLDLALEAAPDVVRAHGLRAGHPMPLVSWGKDGPGGFRSWRTSPAKAWRYPELEYGNAGSSIAGIVLDCDSPDQCRLAMSDLPPCNLKVVRRANGHFHAVWFLKTPVHRYPEARLGPLLYLATIADYLTEHVGADRSYNGVLAHNPAPLLKCDQFATEWGVPRPYPLAALASAIPAHWHAPTVRQTGIGRNCDLFASLMKWAGRPENAEIEVTVAANALNDQFDHPLPPPEVEATARSVERYRRKWAGQGWHCPKWIQRQAARGRKGGVASGVSRKTALARRNAAIAAAREAGRPIRSIAEEHGLSRERVSRILKQERTRTRSGDRAEAERRQWPHEERNEERNRERQRAEAADLEAALAALAATRRQRNGRP